MRKALLFTAAIALAFLPAQGLAASGSKTFSGEYTVTYLGLPVAESTVATTFSGDNFKIKGSLSSAGVGQFFDSTRAKLNVRGKFRGGATRPDAYSVEYTSGKRTKRTSLRFRDGNVSRTDNVPPLKNKGRDWVRLGESDLRAVADPLSWTLVRANKAADVCQRRIKVFDGEMRVDLKLSSAGTEAVAFPGFEGEAVTCNAQFVPVAGYRKGKEAIEFLARESRITIAFAPLGETGVFAPVRATVGTQIGPITIRARRLETSN